MKKSLIGIVAKPIANEYEEWWHFMGIVDDLRLRLVEAGAVVAGILPTDRRLDFEMGEYARGTDLTAAEREDLEELIGHFDGIVLEGGLNANSYEREAARICSRMDKPLLGVCSGFNNIVTAFGGEVKYMVTELHQQYRHEVAHAVNIKPETKLAKMMGLDGDLAVNSIHTEVAYPEMVKGLEVAAICPDDGTVEAVEMPDKRFLIGVKWHPELMTKRPEFRRFFAEFVRVCGER